MRCTIVKNFGRIKSAERRGKSKLTGKIAKVSIDTKPSNPSGADENTVETAEDMAVTIEN
jgi:hypothetical protein